MRIHFGFIIHYFRFYLWHVHSHSIKYATSVSLRTWMLVKQPPQSAYSSTRV